MMFLQQMLYFLIQTVDVVTETAVASLLIVQYIYNLGATVQKA